MRDAARGRSAIDRVPAWSGLAVGAAMSLLIVAPMEWSSRGLAISTLPLSLGAGLIVAGAAMSAKPVVIPPLTLLVLFVVATGFIGAVFTGDLDPATGVRMAYLVLLWIALGNLGGQRRTAARLLLTTGSVVAVLCLIEAVRGTSFFAQASHWGSNPFTGSLRAQGTLPHPLVAGYVFLVMMIVSLLAVQRGATRWILVMLFLAAIVATGSSSPLAVGLAVLLFAIVWPRKGATRLVGLVVAAAAVLWAFTTDVQFIDLRNDLSAETNAHRLNSLLAVPRLLTVRPLTEALFGSGWDSAAALYDRRIFDNDGFFAIDNMFVTMLAVGGLVGIIAYLAFVTVIIVRARDSMSRMAFAALAVMGLSFDTLLWPVAASMTLFVAAWVLDPRAGEHVTGRWGDVAASRDRPGEGRQSTPGRRIAAGGTPADVRGRHVGAEDRASL